MTTTTRKAILRANGAWLLLASTSALAMDVIGAFFARGPESVVLRTSPEAAIGFIEAHGLAFILGILLWRAAPLRSWHLTGVAVHALLGTANVVFWQMFVTADVLAVGYVTTFLHFLFVLLQVLAATARGDAAASGRRLAASAAR